MRIEVGRRERSPQDQVDRFAAEMAIAAVRFVLFVEQLHVHGWFPSFPIRFRVAKLLRFANVAWIHANGFGGFFTSFSQVRNFFRTCTWLISFAFFLPLLGFRFESWQ